MELHQLKCFLELSKFQNVSLTAAQLNVSQPALSKTISLLEADLGIKLFDRIGRRIYLNERGTLFAQYAEQMMQALHEGTQAAKKLDYQPSGTICLGLFAYVSLISDCIGSFMKRYPLVKFELYSSKSQYTIDNFDRIDFTISSALTKAPVTRDDILESFPIAQEQYLLVVAPELLEKYISVDTDLHTLSALHQIPFLSMANNLMFSDITYTICQQAGFVPNAFIQTNDYATKLHMTAQGLVAAFIPEVCVPVFRSMRPDFRFLRFSDVNTLRTIRLSRKKTAHVRQACDAFWNYAQEYYDGGTDSTP